MAAINGVRVVRAGVVFINDRASRRIVVLDEKLHTIKVVLDTSSTTGASYGHLGNRLIAMPGDSTMFVDAASRSVAVFDAQGRIARREGVPRQADLGQLLLGSPAFDAQGRLVYRGRGLSQLERLQLTQSGQAARPETVPILRLDLATGQVDTAEFVRIYQHGQATVHVINGVSILPVLHPAPVVDEWTVLSDGRIAVVRGEEYRVDYVGSSGTVAQGASIPFAAQPLDLAGKMALIEASRAARANMLASGLPLGSEVAPLPGAVFHSAPGVRVVTHAGGTLGPEHGGGSVSDPNDVWVSPDELPDRVPVFPAGGVHADADGNVWVQRLASATPNQGSVYDVVGPTGQRIDQVRVPPGTVIVGFTSGGGVLLARRTASGLGLVRMRYIRRAPIP